LLQTIQDTVSCLLITNVWTLGTGECLTRVKDQRKQHILGGANTKIPAIANKRNGLASPLQKGIWGHPLSGSLNFFCSPVPSLAMGIFGHLAFKGYLTKAPVIFRKQYA